MYCYIVQMFNMIYDDEEVKLSTWLYAISSFIQAYQWEHSGKR